MKKVIHGGTVCDGSGNAPIRRDILIENGRIAALALPGELDKADAERIDASGKMTVPGLIDAHAHDDTRKLLFPEMRTKLLQGVTTEVDGNCGSSSSCVPGETAGYCWNDLAGYARVLDEIGIAVNTVVLCGHNSLRYRVMGNDDRAPSADELEQMRGLLSSALAAGAAGWSSGLTYFPGKFAVTAELAALAEVLRGTGKVYATHLRSEGDRLLEAVDEAAEIAAAGSGKLQISHLKTIFPQNFHKIDALLAKIDELRRSGLDVRADRYPYIHSSTSIAQTLPPPYSRMPDIGDRLRASEAFQAEVAEALKHSPRDLPTTILLKCGRTLAEIAGSDGVTAETACMRALTEDPHQSAAYLCMSQENLERILDQPYVCAGSDNISLPLDDPASAGHPRSAGTFPKFFRMVAARHGVGEAVRRMTSLPAEIFRIPERGLVRAGYVADLAILDAENYDTRADFSGGDFMPTGVARVLVAGHTAWSADDPPTVRRFGRFLAVN